MSSIPMLYECKCLFIPESPKHAPTPGLFEAHNIISRTLDDAEIPWNAAIQSCCESERASA